MSLRKIRITSMYLFNTDCSSSWKRAMVVITPGSSSYNTGRLYPGKWPIIIALRFAFKRKAQGLNAFLVHTYPLCLWVLASGWSIATAALNSSTSLFPAHSTSSNPSHRNTTRSPASLSHSTAFLEYFGIISLTSTK